MENKREQILIHAKKLIAERGYHGTSMRELAQAAGVAQGTPYLYFKNKEEMFVALLEHMFDEVIVHIETINRASKGFWEAIERYFEVMMEHVFANKDIARIFMREALIADEGCKDHTCCIVEVHNRMFAATSALVRAHAPKASLRKGFSVDEVSEFIFLIHEGMMKKIIHGYEDDPKKAAARAVKYLRAALEV